MQVRTGVGWQYALADLSLILFMVCAAALAREQKAHATRSPPPRPGVQSPAQPVAQPVALADPVAVWRAGPGMPSLAEWLAAQTIDRRQRLTIVARYAGGRAQIAFARAQDVLQAQPRLPPSTRIVVEPAPVDDLSATLTWDVGGT
ncbi:MAG TPA: hypothetical protein VI199_10530 [Novosphingobium sp.]